jgi:hypothetical protein
MNQAKNFRSARVVELKEAASDLGSCWKIIVANS